MVTVRVPATTANLGPGFDCLGIALGLYNSVTVERASGERRVHPGSMVGDAALRFFAAAALEPFEFSWKIDGEVPRSRGLGSSVTVRLGLLAGLNGLAGGPLSREQVFELCAELEGHPDNAAPAVYGGFTAAGGGRVMRFPVREELAFVLLIPDFEISTPRARSVLPGTIDRLAAVRSCANACRITAAFASGDYEALRGSFEDGLHQPFREPLIPFLPKVLRRAEEAGALGGFLSGSGSTICALVIGDAAGVAEAMSDAAGQPGAQTHVTRADNEGAMTITN